MFRKNKTDYKAKLEHKLYLARENPEPVFDLIDCGLRQIPTGVFTLCKVFLKESLLLDNNKLTSLSNGGNIRDLHLLKVLSLQFNNFSSLPDDLSCLNNLQEFYVNDNNLKKLPTSIGSLEKLRILDISNNDLRNLPNEIGNLRKLQQLKAIGNKHLNNLPHSICQAKKLTNISVDAKNFVYPPTEVVELGTESIKKFICHDNGIMYESPTDLSPTPGPTDNKDVVDFFNSNLEEKIWEFEKLKQQKLQEKLKFEKEFESFQKQELELQAALKINRQKFLTDLTEQQIKLDHQLARLQQEKEVDRMKLIKELQEEEKKSDIVITNMLNSMREPLSQLLEQEKLEEEKLLAACAKQNENLRRSDVLDAMRMLLEEETNRFRKYDMDREETARSILSEEMKSDSRLSEVLRNQCEQQAVLVSQLQMDMELQRMAVGALLERSDARSWSLVQQVLLVESQLAKLTAIEIDRKKLEMDEQLNDLAEKRANLSCLLMDLLEQQGVRRTQLLSTLQNMEEMGHSQEDFWLLQYQQLLDRRPTNVSEIQKNIDPEFAQELLFTGVIHYLPFLAHWVQSDDLDLTEEKLTKAGVKNEEDRKLILIAYRNYKKLNDVKKSTPEHIPSTAADASAPSILESTSNLNTECVICMDEECEMIFVPCGHLCCCTNCASAVSECPLCREVIERKIKVLIP